jgi:hypothetical protein
MNFVVKNITISYTEMDIIVGMFLTVFKFSKIYID